MDGKGLGSIRFDEGPQGGRDLGGGAFRQLICDLAGRVAGPPLNAAESHDPNRIGVLA
ncbi:hypothetical protein ACVWXL_000224 [Bradyrhizobium sp. GM22.5]|nr:hypothetical protein [Bradyrhizobium sp. 45]